MGADIEELKQKIAPVAVKYELDKVILFGSRARGDGNTNSDFDFYVESTAIKGLFKLGGLFADMESAVGNKVDIVIKPLAGHRHIKDYLLKSIQEDGVLLYAR